MSDWKLPDEALQQGVDVLSVLGQEKVRAHERLAQAASEGKSKLAVLSSDAETGWAFCARHGHCRTLDKHGNWAPNGVCENCFKGEHSPQILERRRQETSSANEALNAEARAIAEADERRRREAIEEAQRQAVEARAKVDAETPRDKPTAYPGPVDEGIRHPLRGSGEHAPPDGVDRSPGMGQGEEPRRSPVGPSSDESDQFGDWLRRSGVE